MNTENGFKIFIGGVQRGADPQALLLYFKKLFPSLESLHVPMKTSTGNRERNKGYALIELGSSMERDRLLDTGVFYMQDSVLVAKPYVRGNKLKKLKNLEKSRAVHMPNLPPKIPLKQLKNTLELNFGPVDNLMWSDSPREDGSKLRASCFFKTQQAKHAAMNSGYIQLGSNNLPIFDYKFQKLEKMKRKPKPKKKLKSRVKFVCPSYPLQANSLKEPKNISKPHKVNKNPTSPEFHRLRPTSKGYHQKLKDLRSENHIGFNYKWNLIEKKAKNILLNGKLGVMRWVRSA